MNNNKYKKNLALAAFDEIPEPKANSKKIIAVVKKGKLVTGYKLSDSTIVSKDNAINLARNGDISGVGIAHNKDNYYLKTIPDENMNNNISNLPIIEEN